MQFNEPEVRDKIVENHEILHTHQKDHGASTSHPEEDLKLDGIRKEYKNLGRIVDEKIKISSRTVELVMLFL